MAESWMKAKNAIVLGAQPASTIGYFYLMLIDLTQ
jgi:hypothetical protein